MSKEEKRKYEKYLENLVSEIDIIETGLSIDEVRNLR